MQYLFDSFFFIIFSNSFIDEEIDKMQEGIQDIEALFKEINPNHVFKYTFLSDDVAAKKLKLNKK